jgi:hypothetical protein
LKQDLVSALRVATIFSDKFNKLSVRINPKEKKFELATRNADVGENSPLLKRSLKVNRLKLTLTTNILPIASNQSKPTVLFWNLMA